MTSPCDRCLKEVYDKMTLSDTIGSLCHKCEEEWIKYQEY